MLLPNFVTPSVACKSASTNLGQSEVIIGQGRARILVDDCSDTKRHLHNKIIHLLNQNHANISRAIFSICSNAWGNISQAISSEKSLHKICKL